MEKIGECGDVGAGIFLLGDEGRLESCRLMLSLFEFKFMANAAPELWPKDIHPSRLDELSLAFVLA